MKKWPFIFHMILLQLIGWIQRALRVIIRFIWLLLGFRLLILANEHQNLVIYRPIYSQIILLVLSAVVLLAMFIPWPRFSVLAWKLDRGQNLKEQVTTAWQVIQNNQHGQIAADLVDDAVRLVRRSTWRILGLGWHLVRDIFALLIMLLLTGGVQELTSFPGLEPVNVKTVAELPPLGFDERAEDVFPSGIPGLETAASQPGDPASSGLSPEQFSKVAQALSEFGEQLSQQANSYNLGQSLREGDYRTAAQKAEELASQLENLSTENLESLEKSFNEAASKISQMDAQNLAAHLQNVANGIQADRFDEVGESMDGFASEMRKLAKQQASMQTESENGGGGAGLGSAKNNSGTPEEINRLSGEGDTLEFLQETEQPGSLAPGGDSFSGDDQTIGGQYDLTRIQNIDFVNTFLNPYHYPWTWRDVVSEYFSK